MQHLKDGRAEGLDEEWLPSCKKKKCKLKHAINWLHFL
jgi:hypothetical protein